MSDERPSPEPSGRPEDQAAATPAAAAVFDDQLAERITQQLCAIEEHPAAPRFHILIDGINTLVTDSERARDEYVKIVRKGLKAAIINYLQQSQSQSGLARVTSTTAAVDSAELKVLFHEIWTSQVDTSGYDKKKWRRLRQLLSDQGIRV